MVVGAGVVGASVMGASVMGASVISLFMVGLMVESIPSFVVKVLPTIAEITKTTNKIKNNIKGVIFMIEWKYTLFFEKNRKEKQVIFSYSNKIPIKN